MRKRVRKNIYAVYKGDEFLFSGTSTECSQYLGIKESSFYRLGSPAYKKRFPKNRPSKAFVMFKLEKDDENENVSK